MDSKNTQEKLETPVKTSLFNSIYLWIGIALILLIGGWFGLNALLSSFETYKLTLVDYPKEVIVGNNMTFTWDIIGPSTTFHHTSVRMGLESTPGELTTETKPEQTKYTEVMKDFENGEYRPMRFVGNMSVSKIGRYYFRVYALIKGKHYWSDEYTLEVKKVDNTVTIADPKGIKKIKAGSNLSFTWDVAGPAATINNTAIYYGTISQPGPLGKEVAPAETKYTEVLKDFTKGKYNIPFRFIGNIKVASPGAYFFRAHALINNQHYWSEEGSFEVE